MSIATIEPSQHIPRQSDQVYLRNSAREWFLWGGLVGLLLPFVVGWFLNAIHINFGALVLVVIGYWVKRGGRLAMEWGVAISLLGLSVPMTYAALVMLGVYSTPYAQTVARESALFLVIVLTAISVIWGWASAILVHRVAQAEELETRNRAAFIVNLCAICVVLLPAVVSGLLDPEEEVNRFIQKKYPEQVEILESWATYPVVTLGEEANMSAVFRRTPGILAALMEREDTTIFLFGEGFKRLPSDFSGVGTGIKRNGELTHYIEYRRPVESSSRGNPRYAVMLVEDSWTGN